MTQIWFKGPIINLDAAAEANTANQMYETAMGLAETLSSKTNATMKGFDGPGECAKQLADQIDHFRGKLPLVKALCNSAMRERHWEKISNILGFAIEPDNSLTVESFLHYLITLRFM